MSHFETTLTVEARDLDTDERSRSERRVAVDPDSARQRALLAEVVAGLYPAARLRSFADGAATFLDRQHLIVASLAELPPRRHGRERPASDQEALFAG